jgi:hypothetical protein
VPKYLPKPFGAFYRRGWAGAFARLASDKKTIAVKIERYGHKPGNLAHRAARLVKFGGANPLYTCQAQPPCSTLSFASGSYSGRTETTR